MTGEGLFVSGVAGVAVGLVGALLAAGFLVLDFALIEDGVAAGWDERQEWRAAFGLVLTLVWLYLQMLRILGAARR